MKEFIIETINQSGVSPWLVQIAIVLVITLIASRIRHVLLNRVESRLSSTRLVWGKITAKSIRKPAALLIWILGILYCFEIVRIEFEIAILDALPSVQNVVVISILTWFLYKLIGVHESEFLKSKHDAQITVDKTTVQITAKILRITVVILGILVAMQTLGLNIAGILAFGGVGGIAVGFAAREMISNYFGALMIFMDRPFEIGETITSPDRDIQGTVVEIGWRLTIIERFDSRTLYVPNSVFSSIAVRNLTRQNNRRIYEYVGIRYDDADCLAGILEDTKNMILNHPEIDQNGLIMVNFDRFAPSSLDFFIYCFTKTVVWSEYHDVKEDILMQIIRIIENHGAQIAFPTSTIHLVDDANFDNLIPDDFTKNPSLESDQSS